jgi:propionyl-CoA synthetase
MGSSFAEVYQESLDDPEGFWSDAAAEIDWYRPWDVALDRDSAPASRWFVGGMLNTCFNTLDRHADSGRGDQAALIYDSPVTGSTESFTYSELRDRVATFAGVLHGLGVGRGDRVVLYMPMIPEAVVAMLACARRRR